MNLDDDSINKLIYMENDVLACSTDNGAIFVTKNMNLNFKEKNKIEHKKYNLHDDLTCVRGLCFGDDGEIFSGGWDSKLVHTLI